MMSGQNESRRPRTPDDFMARLQKRLLRVPAMIGAIVISVIVAVVGYGLIEMAVFVVQAIPQYRYTIEKISLPIVLIGAAALFIGILVIMLAVTRSARRVSDTEALPGHVSQFGAPDIYESQPPSLGLPPAPVVEGSIDMPVPLTESGGQLAPLNSMRVWFFIGACGLVSVFAVAQTVGGGITTQSIIEAIPSGCATLTSLVAVLSLLPRLRGSRRQSAATVSTRQCPRCGSSVSNSASFCNRCGTRL